MKTSQKPPLSSGHPSPIPDLHQLDHRAGLVAQRGTSRDEFLTTKQVAAWLHMSRQWLEIGRHKGYGPPFCRLSPTRIRYRRDAVISWLREREYASTSQYRKRG
jgi:hypothetical protein